MVTYVALGVSGLVIIILSISAVVVRNKNLLAGFQSFRLKWASFAFVPKAKILIAVFQMIFAIPSVYDVQLPPEYYEWMEVFAFATFEWDQFVVPGSCLPGGFRFRVLLRGLVPLLLMLAIVPINMSVVFFNWCRKGCRDKSCFDTLWNGLFQTLPYFLFIAFCFVASVSSGLFQPWSYDSFDVETPEGSLEATQLSYLRVDYQIVVDNDNEMYTSVRELSLLFIFIWPIGVPLLYLLVLWPNRYDILQRHSTAGVRATAFLHREYEPQFFFWEAIFLLERLLIIGFLQWIPPNLALVRLQVGQIVTLIYTVVLLLLRPFRRHDMNLLAISAQITLLAIFYGAINVKLFALLRESSPPELLLAKRITGFSNATSFAGLIFSFNLLSLVSFVAMTIYQALTQRRIDSIIIEKGPPNFIGQRAATLLQVHKDTPPEWPEDREFKGPMKWHLFLSHTWKSGQDQVATIKRQMNLLLPGIKVFLDVDDLQDISEKALEGYVEQSQCILIFLSRGYFSGNCLVELRAALEMNKPIILVHETDWDKGGAPLNQLMDDCRLKSAERINGKEPFDFYRLFRESLPTPNDPAKQGRIFHVWHRIHDFQMATLKGIAAQTLLACPGLDEVHEQHPLKLSIPNSVEEQRLTFEKKVKVYTSPNNPGATDVGKELKKAFGANFTCVDNADDFKACATPRRRLMMSKVGSSKMLRPNAADEVTHMLVYLNRDTFKGEADQLEEGSEARMEARKRAEEFAEELHQAMTMRIPIVLLHENDTDHPVRKGCEFGHFFKTTPDELIQRLIYKPLALALYGGPMRTVSLAIIGKAFGAERNVGAVFSTTRALVQPAESIQATSVQIITTTTTPLRKLLCPKKKNKKIPSRTDTAPVQPGIAYNYLPRIQEKPPDDGTSTRQPTVKDPVREREELDHYLTQLKQSSAVDAYVKTLEKIKKLEEAGVTLPVTSQQSSPELERRGEGARRRRARAEVLRLRRRRSGRVCSLVVE